MAKLIVKDPKTGDEREMTEKSFQLAAQKRGWKIVGKVEEPKSEIQKLMDQKIAEKAAREAAVKESEIPVYEPKKDVSHETVTEKPKAKPGPKPKTA